MKYLQTLCEQADVHLTLKYYCPYLNALEERLLREAAQKKSTLHALHLLKALSLQILFLLQHSACLWGESYWQSLLTQSQSALTSRGDDQQLQMALHKADEVISTASVTEIVRKKIWREVKGHAILPDSQAQCYESARQECFTRQTVLNELEDEVNTTIHDYHQMIEYTPPLSQSIPSFRPNSPTFSHPLRSYDVKMVQTRLSKEYIHHQIQCEGDARIVYQSLTRELGQKPAAEKMAEEVEKAKSCLQRHTEQIAEKTDHYRRQITEQTQFAIEHRTQVTFAHANRIESISLSLATIIHLLQPHVKYPCLFRLMTEAQTMQELLDTNADSADMQSKLLTIHHHRDTYEKSITSVWSTLFDHRQLQYQKKLNADLQTTITRLVIPVCGFNDRNTVITPEKIKQLQKTANKLAAQQGCITQEQVKIDQIQNIFQPPSSF
jgi:hypothetical protein